MINNVFLRDVIENDLPIFFDDQMDQDANQMAAFPPRDREAFTAHWMKILKDKINVNKTILFDGEVVGYIVCFEQSGKREVGYWIGKKYWGKGIGTQALSEFLKNITDRPLYAHVAKHNIASIRILEKCGFRKVGENKEFSKVGGEVIEGFILRLL